MPSLSLFGYEIGADIRFFLFAWFVVGLLMMLESSSLDLRMGRALRALSTSELAAKANGIDVHAVKLGVFVLSAVMAGIAGFLYVHLNNFASPENFDFSASVMLLVVVALGGAGTYWGPFLGTAPRRATRGAARLRRFRSARLRRQPRAGAAVLPGRLQRRHRAAWARRRPWSRTMTAALLEARGVTRMFAGLAAVQDLSFGWRRAPSRP